MSRSFLVPAAVFALQVPLFGIAQDSAEKKDFDPFADAPGGGIEFPAAPELSEARDFLDPKIVTALTERVRPALVTVRQMGRDGENRGTGSGFVVAKEGLVATNLHVIGEGRPIEVEFADGSKRRVVEVHASDRHYDLAILRLESGKDLPALEVDASESARQGDLVLGFGAPQGLGFSVVPGAISAIRQLEPGFAGEGETPEFPMLQIAMPIEQGNSGGPVVNLEGEVVGVVTLRHRLTNNLGFAVPSKDLHALLAKPNPVPMERWTTIGSLDSRIWTEVMDADWSQRGGVVTVRRAGEGFGGRALCLQCDPPPESSYEVAVKVKLAEESGAAGLAFASDGGEVHYGFYPSNGRMRLTRFEGGDVSSWTILEQVEAPSYVPGEWNRLRVRVEPERILAWVNEVLVLQIDDAVLRGGKAGLCKFRQTTAEFREFRVGADLAIAAPTPAEQRPLREALALLESEGPSDSVMIPLGRDREASRRAIAETVESLEARIEALRDLELRLHRVSVERELIMALDRPGSEVDLFEVGLQIARIDDFELDLDHYRDHFAHLAREAGAYVEKVSPEGGSRERTEALRDFLFKHYGFHGSRGEYYHHANSYVNHVLDDREGLPITLSVIFVELARRLGLSGVYGAAVPGRFMVGWNPGEGEKGEGVLFDVFEGGELLTRAEVERVALDMTGSVPDDAVFTSAEPRDIAVRMLRNLVDLEINRRQTPEEAEGYLELLLAIKPDAADERFQRAILRIQTEELAGAREDLDWLLEHRPPGLDYDRLEQFRASLERE